MPTFIALILLGGLAGVTNYRISGGYYRSGTGVFLAFHSNGTKSYNE